MYNQPRRKCAAQRALQPSLEMIERRRREQLDGSGAPQWHAARTIRAAAAAVVAMFVASVSVGLQLIVDSSVVAAATPAEAAQIPVWSAVRNGRAHGTRQTHRARSLGRARIASMNVISPAAPLILGIRVSHMPPSRLARRAILERRSQVMLFTHKDPDTPSASPSTQSAQSAQVSTLILITAPWRLTADGTWTTIVSCTLPPGNDPARTDIQWSSASADVLPLDVHASGAPGAIVTIAEGGSPVEVTATTPRLALAPATITIEAPPQDAASFSAVAQAIGPHLVSVGWTPLGSSLGVAEYKVYREAPGASSGNLVATVSPRGRSWQDASVAPGSTYAYSVAASLPGGALTATTQTVIAPLNMRPSTLNAISGKGMFLYFSPAAGEANSYDKYDPQAVVDRAVRSGITHIEVRMARGTFFEGTDAGAHAWLDDLIDKATVAGVRLIAWQVPRRATSDDAAQAVAAARYRTAAGNGFEGLALDVEDGDSYMGFGEAAKQRMVDHIEMVRKALGPDYLIVATVMSPKLTHWTNKRYPYDRIAPYATVMQPMEYWHHFYSSSHHDYTADEVNAACADSVSLTQGLAGRQIPINVAGQSDDLGTTGAPSPQEIGWCLTASKAAGAIGQTFFDWHGTSDEDWSAIAGFSW